MTRINGREVDLIESGEGPLVLFVPGAYSTPAAWRGIQKRLPAGYRMVSISLQGYGATEETRSKGDLTYDHQIRLVEYVVRHFGGPVHLLAIHSVPRFVCWRHFPATWISKASPVLKRPRSP